MAGSSLQCLQRPTRPGPSPECETVCDTNKLGLPALVIGMQYLLGAPLLKTKAGHGFPGGMSIAFVLIVGTVSSPGGQPQPTGRSVENVCFHRELELGL